MDMRIYIGTFIWCYFFSVILSELTKCSSKKLKQLNQAILMFFFSERSTNI
jgi:hypothetical protein